MKDQIIITMGREHGSGGHYIADMIARELGIKLYDKDSIESEIVSEGYSEELIRRMDEKPVNFFASRRIGRFSNSLEVNVAEKTFDMIRAKAASGAHRRGAGQPLGRRYPQDLRGRRHSAAVSAHRNRKQRKPRQCRGFLFLLFSPFPERLGCSGSAFPPYPPCPTRRF